MLQHLEQRISIVGAGIAGLVTAHGQTKAPIFVAAICLRGLASSSSAALYSSCPAFSVPGLTRAGFKRVRLFDRAPSLAASCAGLRSGGVVVASNGCRVLDRFALLQPLLERGNALTSVAVRTATDHGLAEYSPNELSRAAAISGNRYSDLAILGRKLHDTLANTLPAAVKIHYDAEVKLIRKENEMDENSMIRLHFREDASDEGVESDLVIGADGLHSRVRSLMPRLKHRIPTHLDGVYVRGVTPANVLVDTGIEPTGRLTEVWGVGKKLAFFWVDNRRVAWIATLSNVYSQAHLPETFSSFPNPIPMLIEGAPASSLSQLRIEELSSSPLLHDGRVVLVGAAAHASTEDLWQNVAQDVEDGASLATLLARMPTLDAVRAYERMRFERTDHVERAAHEETKQAIEVGRLMASLRDMATSLMPPAAMRASLSPLLSYDAIDAADRIATNVSIARSVSQADDIKYS